MFYVYSHKNKRKNEIFYIGMGSLQRTKLIVRENYAHRTYIEMNKLTKLDIEVTILYGCEDKKKARDIEDYHIEVNRGTLVNKGTNKELHKKLGILSGSKNGLKNRELKRGIFGWSKEARSDHLKRLGNAPDNIARCRANHAKALEAWKKKVICVDDHLIFDSLQEAATYYKLHKSGICNVCRGNMKTTGGKIFKYVI